MAYTRCMKSLLDICKEAVPRLDPAQPINRKELHSALYVDREEPATRRLFQLLELSAIRERSKLLLTGHIGSGKSTELYHLKRKLEEARGQRYTVIDFSVADHADLLGLDTRKVLVAIARAVFRRRSERSSGGGDPAAFEARLREAAGSVTEIASAEQRRDTGLGLEGSLGPVKGKANTSRGRSVVHARRYDDVGELRRLVELVNGELEAIREARPRAELLLVIDDLEKLDIATARAVFKSGLAIASIDAAMVLTVPLPLLYSSDSAKLLGHFDPDPTTLPLIKVTNRRGEVQPVNVGRMRRVIERRVDGLERVCTPAAMEHLALVSGGCVRDLIRMLRRACLDAIVTERSAPYEVDDLRGAEAEIRTMFQRQVHRHLRGRLGLLRGGDEQMDEALAELITLAAVLEYNNDDTWYRLHPLVDHLVDAD